MNFFFFFWIDWLKTIHTKRKYVHEPGFTIFTNLILDLISLTYIYIYIYIFVLRGERHKN